MVAIRFTQQVLRAKDNEPLVVAQVRVACVDARTMRPRKLPEQLLNELK
jgi:acyl-CoA thioesterase FadM